MIAQKIADAEKIALALETTQKRFSAKKTKEAIKGFEPISFIKYADQP